jgi:zinc transporter ZupT
MENDMSALKPRFAVAIATASISACSTLTGAAIGAAAASIAGTVVDNNR